MNTVTKGLKQSALVMRILGWGLIAGLTGGLFLYPPGFCGEVILRAFLTLVPRILSPRSRRYIPTSS
jgi:hypothetical protein